MSITLPKPGLERSAPPTRRAPKVWIAIVASVIAVLLAIVGWLAFRLDSYRDFVHDEVVLSQVGWPSGYSVVGARDTCTPGIGSICLSTASEPESVRDVFAELLSDTRVQDQGAESFLIHGNLDGVPVYVLIQPQAIDGKLKAGSGTTVNIGPTRFP